MPQVTSPKPADPTSSPRSLAGLPEDWTARLPQLDDLGALVELRGADKRPWTGSASVDREAVESEVAGPASWTRRQVVLVDPDSRVRGWVVVHDRAAGRTMLHVYVDRALDRDVQDRVADAAYAFVAEQAAEICRLRGTTATRLDASPFAEDEVQRDWLRAAGYELRRTWLQMSRPVVPSEADELPAPREGVTIRRVDSHENDLPVAGDLQIVHEMLESSFEDHFNSYRESFPEFVQRLREDPGHRWDHWWLAFVEVDGRRLAAGAVVSTVLPEGSAGHEGSYVDYIGVHRDARGRGVAKALLHTVIADAARRGRDRVGLEVDDDSPTGADGLYTSMGWTTDYVTESWFRDLEIEQPDGATP
ncbi:GCN5 family acetyltransferase [Marmoricola sp. Leaf446]|nr:GCN5 family acetyltransferase [Marmoricola sp. Leaf446]